MALTAKQIKFCLEYCVDSNATQAAIRAGYSEDTARSIGSENLTKPDIVRYINKLQNETAKSLGVTRERVINELAKLAFLDPRKFFDGNSRLIPIKDVTADAAACLTGLEVDELWETTMDGRVQVGETKKVKFVDKKGALDSLARICGWNEPEKIDLTSKGKEMNAVTIFQLPDNGRNAIQGNPAAAGLPDESA